MPARLSLLALMLGTLVACGIGSDDANDSGASTVTSSTDTGSVGPDPVGMVAAHNFARGNAIPTPSPALPDVSWDPAVAKVAQAWADRCDFNHSGGQYGENLYVSTWEATADEVVQSWFDEIADYDYDSNSCSGVCGHYTQVVWRDSIRIGCAYSDCDTLTSVGSFTSGRLWVCNYDPPGNWVGEWPY